jgi:hypothetical protein
MNRRKDPLSLEEISLQRVRLMVREVGIRWSTRLHTAALMDRYIWLREVQFVEEECILVHHTLGLRDVPFLLESISSYAVMDFKTMISTYDRENRRWFSMDPHQQYIYENICAVMIKSILFPCMSRCNIGDANSEFAQGLLIKLLYVIPKIKALILPAGHRLTNMVTLSDRIQILTRLEEFEFRLGCTSEIIIELSNHCPRMKKISYRIFQGCGRQLC